MNHVIWCEHRGSLHFRPWSQRPRYTCPRWKGIADLIRGEAKRHRAALLQMCVRCCFLLALPLGSTTHAHHFFCLAEFRDPFSRRCDPFSHHHLFRALRATDLLAAHSSGYSLHVHGVRSLTLRTRHPSPDHSLYPYPPREGGEYARSACDIWDGLLVGFGCRGASGAVARAHGALFSRWISSDDFFENPMSTRTALRRS